MKKMIFVAMCATAILFGSPVKARMGDRRKSASAAQTTGIEFQTFDLDGQVHDLMWCGANDEIVLMQTDEGVVYRSRDRGQSWKRLKQLMMKQGQGVVDYDQDIGRVHKMQQSPVDDQLVVFVGTNGVNWVSEDCGGNIRALNSGRRIQEFMFHPVQRTWALAASWTTCAEFVDEPCRIVKELYYTTDLGEKWEYVTDYVFDFEWGQSTKAIQEKVDIPDSRIWLTRDSTSNRHQNQSRKINWSTDINLYYTDDYWGSNTLALEQGNTIIKTPQYMFVSCSHEDMLRVTIYSATYRSGFTNLKKTRMPVEALLTTTFTLMDTSEDQVFLYLENKGMDSPFGTVYISDERGKSFSTSLENVIKGNAVDFERVTSLDGTFIANKYAPGFIKGIQQKRTQRTSLAIAEEYEFDEADMIAEEAKQVAHSRMGRGSSSQNAKQQQSEEQIFKIMESVPASEVQESVKTYITHNKGGKWELIRAPEVIHGQRTNCYIEEGCSLHLEIYSHMGQLAPVYSNENAVGIVLGTGNIGPRLTENDSQKNLYLSRDGGLNWSQVQKGVWIYEIGDHGALIAIARKNQPVNEIEFTWDEGQTWEKLWISDRPLFVTNIIIEPNSISQQFIVYGTYAESEDWEDEDIMTEMANQAFLVYLDFSMLHEPQCQGADNAGAPDSDYELWTPHDGRFGEAKCFLGMHKTFVRRKQTSMCYNGEEHERVTRVEPCTCSDMDFECDWGYKRQGGANGPCVEEETKLSDAEKQRLQQELWSDQCKDLGYYEVTQGYRKIPGNICEGGLDLSPYRYECNSSWLGSIFTFRGIITVAIVGAILYYGWPLIEAVLLLLPIPDPQDMKEKAKEYGGKAAGFVKDLSRQGGGAGAPAGYNQEFGQPASLADDSGEDDEEGDIGKDSASQQKALDYDSDERDGEDGAQQELISMDSTATKRQRVPKLKKPGK